MLTAKFHLMMSAEFHLQMAVSFSKTGRFIPDHTESLDTQDGNF